MIYKKCYRVGHKISRKGSKPGSDATHSKIMFKIMLQNIVGEDTIATRCPTPLSLYIADSPVAIALPGNQI